jgi:4'-phosphopantetheinyl transferase
MLEQAAAAGDRRPLSSRQRTVAHQAMREILGRYLDCPSDRLTLLAHPGGKPFVESPQQPSLEFNLSHSRGIALLAVTATLAVGIDVEARRALDDPVRLARRALPDEDSAQIAALPDTARTDRFLDLWTRMEARQKAIGHGIFGQPAAPALLSSFSFRPDPDLYASLSVSPATPDLALRFFDYGLL